MGVAGFEEGGDHDVAGHGGVGAAGKEVAGVVIEPVEDLDVGAVGQSPVGEVGLPALVGLFGLESPVGGPGPFPGLWGDERCGVQDSTDRRRRGRRVAFLGQVPGDSDRPSVESITGQLEAQCHHSPSRQQPGLSTCTGLSPMSRLR